MGTVRFESSQKALNPENVLSQYETYLRAKGATARTLESRRESLELLFRYLQLSPEDVARVTAAQLRSYVVSLRDRRLTDSTILSSVERIKAFFRFAKEEGWLQRNPADSLPRPRMAHRLPRTLTPGEVRKLLDTIREGRSKADRRNFVVFYFCYTCGLRLGEAAGLRREHISAESGTLQIVGKGDKERLIYLKPISVDLLDDYIAEFGIVDLLFPGAGAGPIDLSTLQGKFKSYVKAAGLPNWVTPHTLRHSVAVHYLLAGAPISFVQQLLGHTSLETTGIYTQLTDAMTKEIALRTPTAIDRQKQQERKLRGLKERRGDYQTTRGDWVVWLKTVLNLPGVF